MTSVGGACPSPRVAMMQPTFLPWQGYFALIATADVFVVLDDFQFERHSFQHRNRLRLADGRDTLVVLPVAHTGAVAPTIASARPLVDAKWRRRIKSTIDQSYGKTPHHDELRPAIDAWLDTEWPSLAELNIAFIRHAAALLGFAPEWRRSSEVGANGQRSERVARPLATRRRSYVSRGARFVRLHGRRRCVSRRRNRRRVPRLRAASRTRNATRRHSSRTCRSSTRCSRSVPTRLADLVLAGQRAWSPWRAAAMTARRAPRPDRRPTGAIAPTTGSASRHRARAVRRRRPRSTRRAASTAPTWAAPATAAD